MKNRACLLFPVLASMALMTGCLESQPPVNRVQPNVTRKADILGGEWYFLQTVVDTPYSTDFTFVGEQGELERVVWEIQEGFLVARRAYENVAGSEPVGINGAEDTSGAVVAMYAIESHFDIRRQYNPVTGEELNVVEENTTDNPWDAREYMRVEWSENLVTNDFLMLSRVFSGAEMESVSWFVQDPEDPNAPRFDRMDPADESSPLGYLEITNKMFVRPTTANLWGLEIPSCWILQVLDGNPVDCASGEITVRNSFLRADPENDYEPFVYTGDRMERFGYFVTERPGYDTSYGLVEPTRYRFANRHNLWAESHRRDAAGDFIPCIEDAQCDDGRGSVCDLDLGRSERRVVDGRIQGACTMAYRDRPTQPIVYHMSENMPADLIPEMRMVEAQWNEAFVGTVASLRENECLSHGGGEECAAERDRADHQNMYVVCASPVPAGAPAACGPEGTIARIGDLRYSLIGYVNEPHRSSPLGYGPSAADPETGEIIQANAFIYGAGIESYAAYGRDIVRLLNGDLREEDVSDGRPVEDWFARMSGDEEGTHAREADAHTAGLDGLDVHRVNAAMDFSWVPHHAHGVERNGVDSPAQLVQRMRDAQNTLRTSGALGDGTERAQARLASLRGTDIERMMTGREARMMAGIDPDLPVDDAAIAQASPLQGMSVERRVALRRARDLLQQSAGLDWGEFADEGLLGLARAVQRAAESGEPIEWHGVTYNLQGPGGSVDYDAVRDMLRHPIMSGLTLHEVGHTLGLRHNFSGSFDALNYHARYWELRDDGNMRPRAWDPMTQAEVDGRINEYAYSTVMDYGHNFVVTDAQGIGHYDHAAIKMGYGDLVEVFEEVADADEMAWANFIQSAGWPVPIRLDTAFGGDMAAYTYTEWPALAGGRANMENRADVPYTSLVSQGLLRRSGIDHPSADAAGRVAVPYLFCSDEQADLNPDCYRYDAGADAYETVNSIIDSYWDYYIFNNFARGRVGFNVSGIANRVHGRYFEKLQRANQTYALYRPIFQDVWGDTGNFDAFWTNEQGMGAYTLAVGAAYETLMRVITAPEPGTYSSGTRGDGTTALLPGGGAVEISGFDGRYLETAYNYDAGYFWFDQLDRVGYFYDKVIAIEVLTDPTTYFIGRDTEADIRRYQLSFASTFGPSMTRFFGGLLGEDWDTTAPRLAGENLIYPDALQIEHGDMEGVPLSPNVSFSIQLYAAVYGMVLIPQTYDQDFLNRARIWVRGSGEEVGVDPSLPVVEYLDPDSGLTYVAVSYPDVDGVEHGVGAQLITRASTLAAAAAGGNLVAQSELDAYIDNIDLVRMLTWHLGFGAQP